MSLNVLTQGGGGGKSASIFVTGLSETDIVTATKDGKTAKGVWKQVKNPASKVPDGYTQLESIASTGTQSFNTGVIPTNNTVAHFENFIAIGTATNYEGFLGSQSADNANDSWVFRRWQTQTKFRFDICGETNVTADMVGNCDIVLDGTGMTVNGTKVSFSPGTVSAKYPLWIFTVNQAGTSFRPSSMSFSALDLSEGDAQTRYYVPAKRDSDGDIGLYDLVNGVFDVGSGGFIGGAEIPKYIYAFEIAHIKEYGTWTVTATNGEKTTTQDVLVDAAVEYEIEMSYILWLYNEGDECEDVTGGWDGKSFENLGTVTKNADNITLTNNARNYANCAAWTTNKIDLTEYTTLKMQYTFTGSASSSVFSICSSTPTSNSDVYDNQKGIDIPADDNVVALDISDITSYHHVKAYTRLWGSSAYSTTLKIHKIWLE